jgi:enolase
MAKILEVKAIEILDSRGIPTIKVKLKTQKGIFFASIPSGTSKGKDEAKEIRDGTQRFLGQGVKKAVSIIEKVIGPKIKGKSTRNQAKIDEFLIKLDGTKDKSRLGVNTILPISIATLKAGAFERKKEVYEYLQELSQTKKVSLPTPLFLMVEGGEHANSYLNVQEFLLAPQEGTFEENLEIGATLYQALKKFLESKYGKFSSNVGLEGGFVPPLNRTEKVLELLVKVAKKLNFFSKIKIGLDLAASHFYQKGTYFFEDTILTNMGMIEFYFKILETFPIFLFEDPLAENDILGWQKFNQKLKEKKKEILVVGDDLTVSNPDKISKAQELNLCNAVILKPNQIGTISEILESAKLAKKYNWKIVVSHRSGETNDDFIADLAVGIGADFIKTGAPARGERVAKYNRLLEIEKKF